MSNLLLQTTQPTPEMTLPGGFVLLLLAGLVVSGMVILRRRLYLIPQPDDEITPPTAIFLGVLVAAIASYFLISVVCVRLAGLQSADLGLPSGQRLAIFLAPLAQFGAVLTIFALLSFAGVFRGVFCWRPRTRRHATPPRQIIRPAVYTYLLMIPWVLVIGIIIDALIKATDLPKQQHVIFDLWNSEPSGVTMFKAVAVLSAVLGAPLAEEVFFRGVLQRMLERIFRSPALAVIFASLAFTATHAPWTIQPPIFLLSLGLGIAYFRSGNILVPILAHALFNAMQFALFFLARGST